MKIEEVFTKNYYCSGFGQNLFLENSCYSCKYKLNSESEIFGE